MKQVMLRIRKRNGFYQPRDLNHLSRLINRQEMFNNMIVESVEVGNDYAILFTSRQLLDALNNQTELYMDGTFDVTFYQINSIEYIHA